LVISFFGKGRSSEFAAGFTRQTLAAPGMRRAKPDKRDDPLGRGPRPTLQGGVAWAKAAGSQAFKGERRPGGRGDAKPQQGKRGKRAQQDTCYFLDKVLTIVSNYIIK
jgi:hypothetical protein